MKLNPLAVLVAILLAVELAGILGALLAIPVAGIIQVVVRDVWDNRRGRPKQRPTVGEDRAPVDTRPGRAGVNRRPLLCLDDALATVEMTEPTRHPWIRLLCPAHSFSRSENFCGFPVAVRGSWSTNSTAFGTLKRAMRVCR